MSSQDDSAKADELMRAQALGVVGKVEVKLPPEAENGIATTEVLHRALRALKKL